MPEAVVVSHDKQFGVETMCGGQGMAMVVERLS